MFPFFNILGMYLFDVEGKKYLDCLAGYAAVSAGHCHPKIVKAIQKQLTRLIHPSRSVYIAHLANYGHYVCKLFNFEKMLPMNTGKMKKKNIISKIHSIQGVSLEK